ncbi:MAG TPA: sigma-54 dependent transcriptional regulator [Longimicrobiales bacterium]|nr:sigma-54 dependent transcriptional regulator [Longimicrobiales bacterium]
MDERILILEDDKLIREVVAERLSQRGFEPVVASTLAEARRLIASEHPDAALLDVKLPDGEGTEILRELVTADDVPCVMMTAHGTIESAVAALRLGALDYLEKPFSIDRVEATMRAALERTRLRRELRSLRGPGASGRMIGTSPAMREVTDLVEKVAPADSATVLILGETGTGKGLLARTIHDLSPRADGPFVNVTCSALTESLMESELFGHEKGAFTDARTLKRGLVEVADQGTLFLDEIAELSPGVQGKLLRFIEEKTFRRVGGTRDLVVNARVVAATNRDLEADVRAGRFRQDLFYRLSVLPIELPPLRHRASDVPLLVTAFMNSYSRELGRRVRHVEPAAMERLKAHDWPGNIRELRNVIERAVLLAEGDSIRLENLPRELQGTDGRREESEPDAAAFGPDGVDLGTLERMLLREALRRAEGNRSEAGRLLGLSRHQVRNRLAKYGGEP